MRTRAIDFLQRVLPSGPGFYCFSKKIKTSKLITGSDGSTQQKDLVLWKDRPITDLEGLVDLSLAESAEGSDTYFAASIFEAPSISMNGKLKFRVAVNAARQKSLWLDIDAKGREGEYADVEDALSGLDEFVRDSGLPEPLTVCSGRGLHVYWMFVEAMAVDRWKALALSLKNVCQKFGLKVDHHRTHDAASVLRIPGTKNYGQDGVVRDVSVLSWGVVSEVSALEDGFRSLLGGGSAPQSLTQKISSPPLSQTPGAVDDLINSFQTLNSPRPAVLGCRHLSQAGVVNYYNWYNALKVLTRCKKGREVAHLVSSIDQKRYDPAVVDEKFDQAMDSDAGPPRCSTFELAENGEDEGWCQACRHHKKFSTPLQCPLPGKPAKVEAEAEASKIFPEENKSPRKPHKLVKPEPFTCDKFSVVPGTGIIWHKKSMEDGTLEAQDIQLAEVELYLDHMTNEPDIKGNPRRTAVFISYLGNVRTGLVRYKASDMRIFKEWLFNNHLTPPEGVPDKKMEDFMKAYLNKLRHKVDERLLYDSLGWRFVEDELTEEKVQGFLLGARRILPGRTDTVTLTSRCLNAVETEFTSKGSLSAWKEAVDMYRVLDQKQGQLFICAGFAAPFMSMHTAETNAMFSLYEPYGGKGKTWVLKMVNSIWGHPDKMFGRANDTFNARYKKLAVRRHLPMCIDEVTTTKDSALVDILYTVAGGQEKGRLKSSGEEFIPGGTWDTITFFTANQSLYEKMENYSAKNTASKRRVIEFLCDFKDYTDTPQGVYIKKMITSIGSNYGLAGAYMIEQYLNDPQAQESIPLELEEMEAEFNQAGNESFWAAGMSAAIVAGRYAKSLGLINYDIDALADWAKSEMVGLRKELKSDAQDAASTLGAFLNDHYDNTLIVLAERRPAGMQDPGNLDGLDSYIVKKPAHKLLVRYEQEEHIAKISFPVFRTWCQERRLSARTVLSEALKQKLVTSTNPVPCSLGNSVTALPRSRVQAITVLASKLGVDYERD